MNRRPIPRLTGLQKPMRIGQDLRGIVGVAIASRITLTRLIWRYIRQNRLFDPADRRYFIPDERMVRVFGFNRVKCFELNKYLGPHLSPWP